MWRWISGVLLTLTALAGPSEAGLIVTIESKQLQTTAPDFVDVSISSDSGDALDSAAYVFTITRLSGPGLLHFGTTNADDLLNNANYVFQGVSTLTPGSPYGSSSQTSYPNDTFIGGDSTQLGGDGNPINATVRGANQPQLLTRLQLTPDQVTSLSSFEIDLTPVTGTGSVGDPTSFTTFDTGSMTDTTVAFTSTSGVITFDSMTSSPEPGSVGLAIVVAMGFLARCAWVWRTRKDGSDGHDGSI